jgi:EpsI family protein
MKMSIKNILLLVLMAAAAAVAWSMRPTALIADQRPKVNLEQLVPKVFGQWRELQQSTGQIVNPQQTVLLAKLYSQTLSRSYINNEGVVVMLSIAYGASQNDGVALHYPEICYPAQGFELLEINKTIIETKFGTISAKQLMTRLNNRYEPVTYWSTLGDEVVQGGLNTKLAQLRYGFNGFIPDGLIFRVSTIDKDPNIGHTAQARFASDLMSVLPRSSRLRLAGLSR